MRTRTIIIAIAVATVVVVGAIFAAAYGMERRATLRDAEVSYAVAAALCEKDLERGALMVERLDRRYGGDWAHPPRLHDRLFQCYSDALDRALSGVLNNGS